MKKEKCENWLNTINQPIYPYILISGTVENCKSYVVLNGANYPYENTTRAVEACFKCLIALRKWPFLCDYVWYFIKQLLYGLHPDKSNAAVNKLIVDLKKN